MLQGWSEKRATYLRERLILKYLFRLKAIFPKSTSLLYKVVPIFVFRMLHKYFGNYPRIVGSELSEIRKILVTPRWNFSSNLASQASPHSQLERAMAEYTGSTFAVSVGSGGSGIYLTLRALGLRPGTEVVTQIDNCSAVAQSIMNAGMSPVFVDSKRSNFLMDNSKKFGIHNNASKAVLATHTWGNSEDVKALAQELTPSDFLIEDCCLALGTRVGGVHVGKLGIAGIFSFGSSKPVQAGEGAVIVTESRELAEELKRLRNWGESEDLANRVTRLSSLSINGRISEIAAAIAIQQLRKLDERVQRIRENIGHFNNHFLSQLGLELMLGIGKTIEDSSFSQVVVKLPEGINKKVFVQRAELAGIGMSNANFTPLTEFSFFTSGEWRNWLLGRSESAARQDLVPSEFPGANFIYHNSGISISRSHFESKFKYREFLEKFKLILN